MVEATFHISFLTLLFPLIYIFILFVFQLTSVFFSLSNCSFSNLFIQVEFVLQQKSRYTWFKSE